MNPEESTQNNNSLDKSIKNTQTATKENKVELSGNEKQLVIFNLGDEEYAIEIHNTREIIEKPEITKVPNSPDFIAGLVNIRGKILSIIDLGKKFNLENAVGKQILVVDLNEEQFGFLIDEVIEITKIDENLIKEAPSILSKKIHLNYLTGVAVLEKRLIIILNIKNILSEEEMQKAIDLEKIQETEVPKTEKKKKVEKPVVEKKKKKVEKPVVEKKENASTESETPKDTKEKDAAPTQ